jgi:ArsR family transcriptional regulator, cadmium/lead-responsive transcriptional repressor
MTSKYNDVGYVKISKHRKKVFLALKNGPKMPSEIVQETKMRMDDVSRALRAMNKKGLVSCINPEMKKGRIYILTNDGKNIIDEIK